MTLEEQLEQLDIEPTSKLKRNRAYYRTQRHKAICRKKRICNEIGDFDWYPFDGQYSKGKIHCSCAMCTYSKTYGLDTLKDKRAEVRFKDALNDYYET